MTTLSESRADIHVAEAIVGLKNLILDPDEVRNGTYANIPQYLDKAEGEVITLRWQGVVGATYTFSITVDASNSSAPIPISIAYAPYIIDNLDTSVSVIYEVRRKNGSTATSSPLVFRIERQLGQNLVAPTVIQAAGGTLDPNNARSGATVRVAYVGMLASDILVADWRGEGVADSHQTEQKNGSLFGYVDFDIPVSVVAASQGKTIRVLYAVIRGANPAVLSQPLELPVSVLGQQHLPVPVVPQASGGTLDLSRFAADASATVEAWPLIAQGQRYWISAQGTLVDGTPHTFYVARGQLVGDLVGVTETVLRSELERFKHESALNVLVKVTFDGVTDEIKAYPFPTLALQLFNRIFLAPTVPEATNGVIRNRDVPAHIVVPASVGLRAGEQVRGVTGDLFTSAVPVSRPGEELRVPVPVQQLMALDRQGVKNWQYEVMGEAEYSSAITPIAVRLNGYENWEAVPDQLLYIGYPVTFPSGITMELLRSGSTGDPGSRTGIRSDGPYRYLLIEKSASVKLSFDGTINYLRFRAYGVQVGPPTIAFYDDSGWVAQQQLPLVHDQIFEYTAPAGKNIRRVEIAASHLDFSFGFDDVGWRYVDTATR